MLNKFAITLMVAAALLTGCSNHEENKEELMKLSVTSPTRQDTSITKEYVAQIHAFRHIELRALERGYLQNIYVDEGQTLHKGQKMFKIMPRVYQADLLKAKAEADLVGIEYKNTKALAEKNIVSSTELALAKAKLNKALAEVKLAETHLSFTDIKAPFDGIMDHFYARNGSLLDEGDLLTTISDNSKVWVYFNVPEAEYLNFRTKRSNTDLLNNVKLQMANGELFNQTGVVETVEADFDNTTGNIKFRATFPNPDKLLRHGETGNIHITVPYKNAMIIPQKATFEVLDQSYVYVINKNNELVQRLIHIADELPYLFIIKDGLKDDDKILFEGLRRVHNGQKIEVNFREPKKLLTQLKLQAE